MTTIGTSSRIGSAASRLKQAWSAYKDADGDKLAAALSYFGFFALFPTLLLAVSVLGFALRGEDAPRIRDTVLEAVTTALPGTGEMLGGSLDAIQRRAGAIGLVGLLGVAWSGLGAVGTLRSSLDRIFSAPPLPTLRGKLRDLRFALAAGALLGSSVALTSITAAGSDDLVGAVAAGVLAYGADSALFVLVYRALPDHDRPWRSVLPAALVAAAGWWLLRTAGGWYVSRSAEQASAAYGLAATTIGLLLAINLASKLTLFGAAFAATAEDQPDASMEVAPAVAPATPASPSPLWVAAAMAFAGLSGRRRP